MKSSRFFRRVPVAVLVVASFCLAPQIILDGPTTLFAAEADAESAVQVQGEGWSFDGKTLTIDGALPSWHEGIDGNQSAPWSDLRKDIQYVKISSGASAQTCFQMFSECSNLQSINGLSNLDTTMVDDMSGMFSSCSSLESIDLRGLATSSVTNMAGMFNYCTALTSADLSGLDTSKVASMGAMFFQCPNLATVNLSGFDTSSATNMDFMFRQCYSLHELDLSSFSGSPSMLQMFWDCLRLTRLRLGPDFVINTGAVGMTLPRTGSWVAYGGNGKFPLTSNEAMAQYQQNSASETLYAVEGFSSVEVDGITETRWFDCGISAANKEVYDPDTDAWMWFDADGTRAMGKDVFIPAGQSDSGKWVRYDENGKMVKGEDCQNGNWYYFDPITGEMAHGEKYLDYDAAHTGWYYFDPITGIMFHGDTFIRSNGGKWVRYDPVTGIMVHGLQRWDGSWYYFDAITGAMAHGVSWVPEWNGYHSFDVITGRG